MTELLAATRAALEHRLALAQSEGRAPSLVAGVVRDGGLAWHDARGDTGLVGGDTAGQDTQYRIGSITKTFTAALVLQLCAQGRLGLDDQVGEHVRGTAVDDRRLAALLSHTAGLGAETTPPWWERTDGTGRDLRTVLGADVVKHREGEVYHYSNVGYGVLGEVVAAVTGQSWAHALQSRLLDPLGLTRTTTRPVAPHAQGLAVHPWADLVLPEPEHDAGVLAPAGQLWSTATDLAVWAETLAGRRPDVLPPGTAAEMRGLATVGDDPNGWATGHSLGLQLLLDSAGSRVGGRPRRLAGHTGSMPGFVAALWVSPEEDLAALVLANATSGPAPGRLAADLIDVVAAAEPRPAPVWRPESDPDPAVLALAGPWYWGPTAFALRIGTGQELELIALRGAGRQSRFVPAGAEVWIGLDGYFRGETLRVVRDAAGVVRNLDLASFVFTRGPYDPAGPVPGGVDADGWRPRP